jgi:hypothetical protein
MLIAVTERRLSNRSIVELVMTLRLADGAVAVRAERLGPLRYRPYSRPVNCRAAIAGHGGSKIAVTERSGAL